MSDKDLRQEILTNELGDRMLNMVAPIYDRSKVALHTFQALGIVLQKEKDFVRDDLILQIFPQTATWGLKYWEEQYGIIPDESKTIEQRRSYVMSMKFQRPPMTPKRIEQLVEQVTGLTCEVKENVAPNTLSVTMTGYPKNLSSLFDMLDKKIPAHLIYTIKGIETIETTTDIFQIATSHFTETIGDIGVTAYERETEHMEATISELVMAMASGNVVERFGGIEVIN